MATDISEELMGCLAWQPDVSDDLFELVTAMAVDDGNRAASEWLLQCSNRLPLELAEKLVARRGVSAAELALFAARDDVPVGTLLGWVRRERRVTVLAEIAAKPDLPQEVFVELAARDGTALKKALLHNDTAPLGVRAAIAAALLGTCPSREAQRALGDALTESSQLQRAVFDRLGSVTLQKHAESVSEWWGLTGSQLHVLQDAVEQHAAAIQPRRGSGSDSWIHNRTVDKARNKARVAARRLAEHPSADEALLERLETFAMANPECSPRTLDDAVSAARRRLALLGDDSDRLCSVSHSKLVELAGSGALCAVAAAESAMRNPLFDTEVAVSILESAKRSARLHYDTEQLLRDWAQGLVPALRVLRAANQAPPYILGLSKHVAAASTAELVEALNVVADSPDWGFCLAEEIVEHSAADVDSVLPDEVVGRFGWFSQRMLLVGNRNRLGALTVDFLHRRFGDHIPTWRVFGSIADESTPIVEAAALAVSTEPPPEPPPQANLEPEPPSHDAPCVQVPLF